MLFSRVSPKAVAICVLTIFTVSSKRLSQSNNHHKPFLSCVGLQHFRGVGQMSDDSDSDDDAQMLLMMQRANQKRKEQEART
eukprot:5186427-Pleurochrysis_carterae.AAC.1